MRSGLNTALFYLAFVVVSAFITEFLCQMMP